MSHTGQQMITIHILTNISRSKRSGNETWSVNKILCEKYFSSRIMQKMSETSFGPLFVFKKALFKIKANSQHLKCNIFW